MQKSHAVVLPLAVLFNLTFGLFITSVLPKANAVLPVLNVV